MSDPDRPPHPGRTSAERRALDRIGCGEPPGCAPKTLRRLLDAGLLIDQGREVRRDVIYAYTVPSYAMPIPVHMAWCSAVAATEAEMEAFEAEMEASRESACRLQSDADGRIRPRARAEHRAS